MPHWTFDNRFLRDLPTEQDLHSGPHQVFSAVHSRVQPTPVAHPRLLGWSAACAEELGLGRPASDADPWVQALAGNALLPGMEAYASCYGGHQFGHWAGQLGDGRAISLGELLTPAGGHLEMQLKGAGPTPYSRGADGRAVLRSSLREFLCSEAMHHLGVPSTRALSLITTGDMVVRDMFYDGHPQAEPGAVVCRVAPSFLRFGHFELPAARQDLPLLQQLLKYTLASHAPECLRPDGEADLPAWFRLVCERTASLMVDWMRVGFVHGVMNTDNMSIHGLTIDYGPYGWLEPYDPAWTPNTTDAEGRRYCFGRQPAIAQWNLACLAQALRCAHVDEEALKEGLNTFADSYHRQYAAAFACKLGLRELAQEDALLDALFGCMQQSETDYCILFRLLARLPWIEDPAHPVSAADLALLGPAFYGEPDAACARAWLDWLQAYRLRLGETGLAPTQRREVMDGVNPKYVLRNYLAQQAIDAASRGDDSELRRLQQVLLQPYAEQPEFEFYAARRPEWARHKAGCSALSCSS